MEAVRLWGLSCHTAMNAEYTAYSNSPHAHVACTECHVGSGASFFVKSKLSGAGQVLALLTNTYPRPIPAPVQQLRPARETCEQCHWPQRFAGQKFFVHTEYAPDEQHAATTTDSLVKTSDRTPGA